MPETGHSVLLEVQDLEVSFPAGGEWTPVVCGISLAVGRGEIVGLVGESGSGKSLTALSVLGLVPPPGRVTGGRVLLDDVRGRGGRTDLLTLTPREMRQVRGGRIGMVFQEPATALNPVYTIGFQVAEAVRAHRRISRRAAFVEAAAPARPGGPGGRRPASGRLPAPALGRPAPAGHDRRGAGRRAGSAAGRRADDGARRDAPGADPRSACGACRRTSAFRCC